MKVRYHSIVYTYTIESKEKEREHASIPANLLGTACVFTLGSIIVQNIGKVHFMQTTLSL
jgi:hypothetical protein